MSQSHENFGKYILLEKIAAGGMAEIYLARSPGAGGVGKFMAIKRILPQFSEQAEFIDMFKDEAKIAVNLSHANIVSIYEFGMEKNQFFLAMDYVEGKNLRQILNKMKKTSVSLSIEQVLYIVKEVANGLDHAHRCIDSNTGKPLNIIHRDMSPQNVMISYEGEVKVVDFGIAKAATQIETTRAGTLKGKFGYMSPEQAEGAPVDLRTDIFALGIVLWELLANDRLFVANNEINTLRKIRECQVPSLRKINPNIPQELERIVSKALAKDRNLRYQTAAAFHRELSRFLNRQYPDFSPQDFAVFVKTLFAAEILDSRKMMVEYSKVEAIYEPTTIAPPPRRPEKAIDVTRTYTDDSNVDDNPSFAREDFAPPDQAKGKGPDKARAPASPAQPQPQPKAPSPVPPTQMPAPPPQMATPRPAAKAVKKDPQPKDDFNGENLTFDTRSFRDYSLPQSSAREGSFYGTRPTLVNQGAFNASSLALPILLILVGVILGSGGFYYHNPTSAVRMLQKLGLYKPVEPEIYNITENALEIPTQMVSISSTPPGAEILVNDKPTREITPTHLRLPQGQTIKLTLRLPGYGAHEESLLISNASRSAMNVILQSERKGFLDVQVNGAGYIMINGVQVPPDSSFNRIPVPADREVTVSAYDPETQAWDEQRIRVAHGAVRRVVLIPRADRSRRDAPQNR